MSDTPGWEWKPKTSSVDSLHHAKLSASKALEPRKLYMLGTTPMKQPTIGSVFFSSPAAAATPAGAAAAASPPTAAAATAAASPEATTPAAAAAAAAPPSDAAELGFGVLLRELQGGSVNTLPRCEGYILEGLPPGALAHNYPFARHSPNAFKLPLNFTLPTDDGRVYARGVKRCLVSVIQDDFNESSSCTVCASLVTDKMLDRR